MMKKYVYYLFSLVTMLRGYRNWPQLLLLPVGRGERLLRLSNGLHFYVRNLMDAWIIKESCMDRDYEVHGVPIQAGWTVIDIGAGIGEFTLLTAKEHPTCTLLAYEPFPDSFRLLEKNLALNRVTSVQAFPLAVAVRAGESVQLSMVGAPVQHTTTPVAGNPAATDSIAVATTSLQQIFEENGVERCDFLKIDCEGCEFALMLEAPPDILQRIDRICMEYHANATPHRVSALAHHLRTHGFAVKTQVNPVHKELGFLYASRCD